MSNKIEGIPNGWDLVRIGKPKVGEWYIDVTGSIYKALDTTPTVLHWYMPIIRKIEKPKQYRPFANATEFKPHREKWFNPKELPDHYIKTIAYNNRNHWNGEESDTWEQMFDKYVFEDGTPFGVEIVE